MEKGYLYYPGCTLKTKASDYEDSGMKVMETLGEPLVEMNDWYCCGGLQSLTTDDIIHQIAPIRTMCCAQEQGEDTVVALCDWCYNTLKQANERMKENEDDLETMNEFLDEDPDYKAGVEIYHLLQILSDMKDEIKKSVKKSLEGLRVAPYYGCMLLRPDSVAIDSQENPTIMEDILEPTGVEMIDNEKRTECCGSYHVVNRPEIVEKRVESIVSYAKEEGAEAVVLSCPLCHHNLDHHQDSTDLPVFYYTELLALAFGREPEMKKHNIDPKSLLKKKEILE